MRHSDTIITNHCKPDHLDFVVEAMEILYRKDNHIYQDSFSSFFPGRHELLPPFIPSAVFTQPLRSYPLQIAVTLKLFLCASIHSSVSLLSTNRDPSCLSMCSNKKPSSSLASDRSACGRPHQALWILFLESVTEFRQCVSRMFLGLLIPFQARLDPPSGGPPGSFSFVCSFHKGLPHV